MDGTLSLISDKRRFSVSNSFRDISMRNFCAERILDCFRLLSELIFRKWHNLFYHPDDWLLAM